MAYETLIIEHEEPILIIKLNRPIALNALNSKLLEELNSALTDADNNDSVRTIILTGSEKAFAAGADIKEMISKSFVDMFYKNFFSNDLDRIQATRKPIIAAVAGYALGGGCELAMRCDFILAADSAKFGQPEINLGVMAGFGGTQLLSKFVGKSKAMEMHLTGRNMSLIECATLVASIKKVLDKAIKFGGTTLKDFRQVGGEIGYFQNKLQVYGKEGQACFRDKCKGTVGKIIISGRSTFYCATCQK